MRSAGGASGTLQRIECKQELPDASKASNFSVCLVSVRQSSLFTPR